MKLSVGDNLTGRENSDNRRNAGCTVEYIENFYAPDEADSILRALLAVRMTPEVLRMFGQDSVTKRLSEPYGIDYPYNTAAR